MLSHILGPASPKTGQECLLGSPLHSERAACCPIGSKVIEQVAALPEDSPQAGEESREAVAPVTAGMQESEQHVHQQRGPDLPLDCLAAMPQEGPQVQRLLDLPEERLNAPARLVQIADA